MSVRDHMMIAHSFRGELFGPAQRLHGATYVIDVELRRTELDENGVVVDIGRAAQVLSDIVAEFNYKNLDEVDVLRGKNTTTEVMAKVVFDRVKSALSEGRLGPGSEKIHSIKITLAESHIARASYESTL